LRRRRGRRKSIYHSDARFRIGMIAQYFHARMDRARDARKDRAERARVALMKALILLQVATRARIRS